MTTKFINCTNQLRTLILFAGGGERPEWLVVPPDTAEMTIRSGTSKVLSWLRAMSLSKRTRELTLTDQPWSDIVRCIAASNSFVQFGSNRFVVALNETLTDEQKIALCDIASEFRPRQMS